ncbi:hypothetical protein SUGI_0253080 [Cryptomeria japonica]|nr:hypothetical protein SUGI_0253080 [Cryptomeria japonica]
MADGNTKSGSYVDWKGRPASTSQHGITKAAKFIFGAFTFPFVFLGLIMLTVQAQIPKMKPEAGSSEHPNAGQAGMLYTGLYMVALGADQFDS